MGIEMMLIVPMLIALLDQPTRVLPLRIDGLVAATFTPFDATGALNLSVVPLQSAVDCHTSNQKHIWS